MAGENSVGRFIPMMKNIIIIIVKGCVKIRSCCKYVLSHNTNHLLVSSSAVLQTVLIRVYCASVFYYRCYMKGCVEKSPTRLLINYRILLPNGLVSACEKKENLTLYQVSLSVFFHAPLHICKG